MNFFYQTGNLVKNIETKKLPNETILGKFSLGVKRPFNKDVTDFIDFVCFNKVAELISQYSSTGDKIGVFGYVQKREYTTQDGAKKSVVDFVVNEVEFYSHRPKEQQTQVGVTDGSHQIEDDDDLPF